MKEHASVGGCVKLCEHACMCVCACACVFDQLVFEHKTDRYAHHARGCASGPKHAHLRTSLAAATARVHVWQYSTCAHINMSFCDLSTPNNRHEYAFSFTSLSD